ncbi:MAG: hypothetical protein JNM14_07730 [Ferruginibacter sp.]|nr:hypothetical protein [Ferruginibacter sp.]
MNQRIYRLLCCTFLLFFQNGILTAQESPVENKTININYKGEFQIHFTTPINTQNFIPASTAESYVVKQLNELKSITIKTDKTSLPPTVLNIKETSGKIWNITIAYKEDIDLENESVFDFADNNVNRANNSIVLRTTEEQNRLTKQTDPIPYSSAEDRDMLLKNYPGIDFSLPPPAQTFNLLETGKINLTFTEDLYNNKKTGLKLAFKHEMTSIGVVCQDIVFDGNNVYLKLLIQNAGENEVFLTGSMLLTLLRQNGSSLTLYPSHIYPARFPIVKPKFQIPVIYVFKAYDVTAEDNLKFEISDRQQKTNLEFSIPGSAYNDSKKD